MIKLVTNLRNPFQRCLCPDPVQTCIQLELDSDQKTQEFYISLHVLSRVSGLKCNIFSLSHLCLLRRMCLHLHRTKPRSFESPWVKDGEQVTQGEPSRWGQLQVCVCGSGRSWRGGLSRLPFLASEMESCETHQSIRSPAHRWPVAWCDCSLLLITQLAGTQRQRAGFSQLSLWCL